MLFDFILIFAMGMTVVLSISIIYFLFIFESLFEEAVYEGSFKAFVLLVIAILLHTFSHASEFFFGHGDIRAFFEILSMVTFIVGIAILTKSVLSAEVSVGVNKKLEEELEKRTAELRERTVQLEESNRLKQLLIDILSHDLLNPVTVIKSASDILLEEKDEETVRVIKHSSERLMEMIKNTASLARLENVQMINVLPLDLGLMLDAVVWSFETAAKEKNISIIYKKGSYPAKANQLIQEVFDNLLSNAIKYSNENSKVVIEVAEAGAYWKVMVKDNGVGIADEDKSRIFQRFQRIKKEGVKGTGLGLAIAKRVIELHGGEIWVEDNPEGGSVFNVTVPKA